jgi:hypothetical protein
MNNPVSFLLSIVNTIFFSLNLCNTSFLTRSFQTIFSVLLLHYVSELSRYIWSDFKLSPCFICNVFFWVFSRRLSADSRRFGTRYQFHLHGQVDAVYCIDLPMKMEPIEGSEPWVSALRRRENTQKKTITYLIYFPKCPNFSSIQIYAPRVTFN